MEINERPTPVIRWKSTSEWEMWNINKDGTKEKTGDSKELLADFQKIFRRREESHEKIEQLPKS